MLVKKLSQFIAIGACLSALSLSGCSGNKSSPTNGGVATAETNNAPLSIVEANTLPTNFGSLNTVVTVYNTSTSQLNNLTIQIKNSTTGSVNQNAQNKKTQTSSQNNNSMNLANGTSSVITKIPAGGRVDIPVTANGCGSAYVSISGKDNNQTVTSGSLFNYCQIPTSSDALPTTTPINIVGNKSKTKLARAYIINPGSETSVTYSSSLHSTTLSKTVETLAKNSVSVVDIKADILSSSVTGGLKITSTRGVNTISVDATPASDAFLELGKISGGVIDTTTGAKTATITLHNKGVSATTGLAVSATGSQGLLITTNTCSTQLAANSSCEITVEVPANSHGAGFITANDGTQNISTEVNWFGTDNPSLTTSATDSFNFPATLNKTVTLTVKNSGTHDFSNVTLTEANNGNSNHPTIKITSSCSSLAVDGTCEFSINATKDSVAAGSVGFYLTGEYTKSGTPVQYKKSVAIEYNIVNNIPVLGIEAINQMSIAGDNVGTDTRDVVVYNDGSSSAASDGEIKTSEINLVGELPSDNSLTLPTNTGTCYTQSSLASSESCSIVVKLGPSTRTSTGTAVINVPYYGGQISSSSTSTATKDIQWFINANSQSLEISKVDVNGSTNGYDSTHKVPIDGSAASATTVALTIKNTGTNTATIKAIQHHYNSFFWSVADNGNCTDIAPGASTCVITYSSIVNTPLAYNLLSYYLGNDDANIQTPSIIFADTTSSNFTQQLTINDIAHNFNPGANTIFAQHDFARVTTTAVKSGDKLTVTTTVANSAKYTADITVVSKFDNYFTGTATGSCSDTTTDGIVTQTCTFPTGTNTLSREYTIDARHTESSIFPEGSDLNGTTSILSTGAAVVVNNPTWSVNLR